jgi:sugar phosphate isomerase/epimerase
LSDYLGDTKHLPAGDGDTDFTAVSKNLAGYEGFYTLEPAYRYYMENAEQKLRAGYAFLERTFAD